MTLFRLVILTLVVQTLPAQRPAPASLRGIVLRANSLEPVPRAKVELRRSIGAANNVVVDSDENGKFAFPVVDAGPYRLLASKSGYVVAEYGQSYPGGPGLQIVIGNGQTPEDIRVDLTPGAVISGRVLDRGKPAGNARVYAAKAVYEFGHRVPGSILSAVTNDLGEYSIFWLPPGRYYVAADVYDGPPVTAPVTTSIGDSFLNLFINPHTRYVFTRAISTVTSDTEMHVPMFYPGTPDFRDAQPIDLKPGSMVRAVDVRADTVHALHVRGAVSGVPLGPNGNPASAFVSLFPRDGTNTAPVAYVDVEPNGSFDFARVRPGGYVLAAASENLTSRVSVDVLDRDVNGISVDLRPSIAISGQIVIEGESAGGSRPRPADLRVVLLVEPILGGFRIDRGASWPVPPAIPMESGAFNIPSSAANPGYPPGDYSVIVSPLLSAPAGWGNPRALPADLTSTVIPASLQDAYVKSIRMGEQDVLGNGLRLNLSGSTRDSLVIIIGNNAGRIHGKVVNGEGQPAPAATVVLIPEDSLRFRVAHKYASTDSEGQYQIQGIAPGDYQLFAWEQVDKGAWQDPEFIRNYESSAKRLQIEEGGKVSVDLTSIPPSRTTR